MIGLVEPINNRITDPRYFLNTPHQGKADISPQSLLQERKEEDLQSLKGGRLPHLQGDAEGAQLTRVLRASP